MSKNNKNLYKPSKEAVDRHNKRVDKIEKATEQLEKNYVDTYLHNLKAEKKGKTAKQPDPKKPKSVKLSDKEIAKLKQRAKKLAESQYRRHSFRKKLRSLMPNEGEPRWAVPLGASVMAFFIIVAIIAGLIISNSNNFKIPTAEQKSYYENLVAPSVLFDETGFETIETAEDNYILLTGIWQEYSENKDNLEYNDYGSYVVSLDKAIERSKEIFGNFSKKIEPFNVVYNHITFNWDSANGYFIIPSSGYPSDITPEVVGIKESRKKTELLVNYLTTDNNGKWEIITQKEITVIKTDDKEFIYSIIEK